MKKLIIGVITSLAIISCEKEFNSSQLQNNNELESIQSSNVEESDRPTFGSDDRAGAPRLWYDYSGTPPYGPDDYGCMPRPGDCWNTVIIVVKLSEYQDVFDAIQIGDEENIASLFQQHEQMLLEHIDERYVSGVINGSYSAKLKGDFNIETTYLQFTNRSTLTLDAVYPFRR